LTNTSGPAAVLTATAGSNQSTTVNTAFASNLLGTLTDQYGNRVPGVTITFTAPSNGASASFPTGNTGVTDANGQVSKGIKANTVPGTYNITAASGGSNPTTTFVNLTNLAGPPAILTAMGGSNQSATVNTAFATALTATLTDEYGNRLAGVLITFMAPNNGASALFVGGNTATTDTNGQVSKNITANTVAGTYNITATASGGNNPSTTFVNLTNTPAAPATLTATAGSNQSTAVNTAFATDLLATLTDQYGNGVPGVTITFSAPGSGASASFPSGDTGVTDTKGQVSKAIIANTVTGTYDIMAVASGGNNPSTTFVNLTNTPGSPASLTATGGSNQNAIVNTAFATPLTAILTDQYGNKIPGATITFSAPGSGASAIFVGGNSGTTDSNGQVSKGIIANTVAGTYDITGRASGGNDPSTTFVNLTNMPAAPDHYLITTGAADPDVAGTPFDVTVTVQDAYGNTTPDYTGTVHFSSGDPYGARLPPDYRFRATDRGMVRFPLGATLYTSGRWDVTATDTATGITGSKFVNVIPAAPDHFKVETSASDPDVAGTAFDVTVTVQDVYANTVTGYRGTVHFSSGDPYGARLPVDYPFQPSDQGQVRFPVGATLYTAGTWDVTATDTMSGITGSAYVNVVAAPAVAFQVMAPDTASSGMPFDVGVVAVDPYGNTDMNYAGTVHFTSSDTDSGVVLPGDYAFQLSDVGMVFFPNGATLITLGDQTITATDTVDNTITGSATVTVTTGPAAPDTDRQIGVRLVVMAVEPAVDVVASTGSSTLSLAALAMTKTVGVEPDGGSPVLGSLRREGRAGAVLQSRSFDEADALALDEVFSRMDMGTS
jgi:hypothetical protein